MGDDVSRLFDEYAVRRARGERPDVQEYLARAGDQADELRGLLDRWVASVPAPAPDPASIAAMEAVAAGEPPIVALRASRGLRRDEVVSALVSALGLRDDTRAKGQGLPPRAGERPPRSAGVNRRVWGGFGRSARRPPSRLLPRGARPSRPRPRRTTEPTTPSYWPSVSRSGPPPGSGTRWTSLHRRPG
jgi:hypothetical protein